MARAQREYLGFGARRMRRRRFSKCRGDLRLCRESGLRALAKVDCQDRTEIRPLSAPKRASDIHRIEHLEVIK